MTVTRQILFIQGGGAGAHDEWDDKLVESLRRELGVGHEIRYPHMPDEGDPTYARWSAAIRREMADLDDGAVVARWGASTVSRTAPGNFIAPHGIAVDSRGDLYVCEVSYTFGTRQNGVDPAEAAAHQLQKFSRRAT